MNGINPTYPPPGEDMALDWMRSQGLPDPGTPEVDIWVRSHIGVDDYDPDDDCSTHSMGCSCEDCMQTYPERFYIDDETGEWENIHIVDTDPR